MVNVRIRIFIVIFLLITCFLNKMTPGWFYKSHYPHLTATQQYSICTAQVVCHLVTRVLTNMFINKFKICVSYILQLPLSCDETTEMNVNWSCDMD